MQKEKQDFNIQLNLLTCSSIGYMSFKVCITYQLDSVVAEFPLMLLACFYLAQEMKGKEEVVQFTARSDTESEHSTQEWGDSCFKDRILAKKIRLAEVRSRQYKSHFLPSSCHMCSWIIKSMQTSTSPTLNLVRDESIRNYTI